MRLRVLLLVSEVEAKCVGEFNSSLTGVWRMIVSPLSVQVTNVFMQVCNIAWLQAVNAWDNRHLTVWQKKHNPHTYACIKRDLITTDTVAKRIA